MSAFIKKFPAISLLALALIAALGLIGDCSTQEQEPGAATEKVSKPAVTATAEDDISAPWSTSCPLSSPIAGGGSPSLSPAATASQMPASKINDLFEGETPGGQLYVRLKELGIPAEREW